MFYSLKTTHKKAPVLNSEYHTIFINVVYTVQQLTYTCISYILDLV